MREFVNHPPSACNRGALGCICLLLSLASAAGAADNRPGADSEAKRIQYQIEAEFIERFTNYIEWPPESFASEASPFKVCTVGEGPLPPLLGIIFAHSRIQGRPVQLIGLKSDDSLTECQILYLAPSEVNRFERIVERIGRAPVLTIADRSGSANVGICINMFVEGTHVRFTINAAMTKMNHLKISPKLLSLAWHNGLNQ